MYKVFKKHERAGHETNLGWKYIIAGERYVFKHYAQGTCSCDQESQYDYWIDCICSNHNQWWDNYKLDEAQLDREVHSELYKLVFVSDSIKECQEYVVSKY